MQEVIVSLVCNFIIKNLSHMRKIINKIANATTSSYLLVIIVTVIFLFGGQTPPSSRHVQTEISC